MDNNNNQEDKYTNYSYGQNTGNSSQTSAPQGPDGRYTYSQGPQNDQGAPVAAEQPSAESTPNAMPNPYAPIGSEPYNTGSGQNTDDRYNQYQYQYANQPNPVQTPVSDGTSTGSMICGILSIVFSCSGLISLILGIIAIVQSSKYKKAHNGNPCGQSTAGLICGIIGIIVAVITIIYCVVIIAIAIAAAGSDPSFQDLLNSIYNR